MQQADISLQLEQLSVLRGQLSRSEEALEEAEKPNSFLMSLKAEKDTVSKRAREASEKTHHEALLILGAETVAM